MVQADAVTNEPFQVFADRSVEAKAAHLVANCSLFLFLENIETAEVLGLLGGCFLGEVDDVDRCPVSFDQFVDRLV